MPHPVLSRGGSFGQLPGELVPHVSRPPNNLTLPPYDGTYMWDSRAASDGQVLTSYLTITPDGALPAASVLDFKSLHEIEPGWDYGYVQVSTDGGATWTNLPGSITTNDNPNGFNSGNGITGSVGDWTDATFDLAAYAGQTVQDRLAYLRDQFVYEAGWKVDAIAIGPPGAPIFTDDVESVKSQIVAESTLGYYEYDEETESDIWVTVPTTSTGWFRHNVP